MFEFKYKNLGKFNTNCIKAFKEWFVHFDLYPDRQKLLFLYKYLFSKLDVLGAAENEMCLS